MTARERLLLIGAVCVLCGLSVGYQIGHFTQWNETMESVQAMQELQRTDAKSEAENSLKQIEWAETGKTDSIIRFNCAMLHIRLRSLEPANYGDRASDAKQFIERARSKVSELQKSGHCPFGSAAQP